MIIIDCCCASTKAFFTVLCESCSDTAEFSIWPKQKKWLSCNPSVNLHDRPGPKHDSEMLSVMFCAEHSLEVLYSCCLHTK